MRIEKLISVLFHPVFIPTITVFLVIKQYSNIIILENQAMIIFIGTLIGLFSQVRNGGDVVRDRALKFLHMKIKSEGQQLLSSKDTEAVLLEEIKNSIVFID